MISFLHPEFLWGIFTISIPILIHLFAKRKYKKVKISSIQLLKSLEKESIQKLKLKELLILIIRILFILCIVFMFSNPIIHTKTSVKSSFQNDRLFLVIDNSLSTQYSGKDSRTIFQEEKEFLKNIYNQYKDQFKIYILYLEQNKWQMLVADQNTEIEDLIKNILPTSTIFSLSNLNSKLEKNITTEGNNILLILSDFQNNCHIDSIAINDNFKKYFILFPFGYSRNLGITNIKLKKKTVFLGAQNMVVATIKNFSNEEYTSNVYLEIDNKIVAKSKLSLHGLESKEVPFSFFADKKGWQKGKIIISNDDFSYDNQFYFVFYVPEKINVLYVNNGAKTAMIQSLKALQESYSKHLEIDYAPSISNMDLMKYRMLIIQSPFSYLKNTEFPLNLYLQKGRTLIVFPIIEKNDISTSLTLLGKIKLNKFLTDSIKLTLDNQFLPSPYSDFKYILGEIPIFFKRVVHIQYKGGKELFRYKNGWPFLIRIKQGNGIIYLATADIRNHFSNFRISPILFSFLTRSIVGSANPYSNVKLFYNINEINKIENIAAKYFYSSLNMSDPKNRKSNIKIIAGKTEPALEEIIENQGFYTLSSTRDTLYIALNLSHQESSREQLDPKKIKYLGNGEVAVYNEIKEKGIKLQSEIYLWKYLLMMAILFLLIEVFLSDFNVQKKYKRSK